MMFFCYITIFLIVLKIFQWLWAGFLRVVIYLVYLALSILKPKLVPIKPLISIRRQATSCVVAFSVFSNPRRSQGSLPINLAATPLLLLQQEDLVKDPLRDFSLLSLLYKSNSILFELQELLSF